MTPEQYRAALKKLGWSIFGAGKYLGFSGRQSQRYAAGHAPIPAPAEKLLQMLLAEKDRAA